MQSFAYAAPETVEQALAVLAEHRGQIFLGFRAVILTFAQAGVVSLIDQRHGVFRVESDRARKRLRGFGQHFRFLQFHSPMIQGPGIIGVDQSDLGTFLHEVG